MNARQNTKELGITAFRSRLNVCIRDIVLNAIDNPDDEARMQNIPATSLVRFSREQRDKIAELLERGIVNFRTGLDDEPDGLEICYGGTRLNEGSGEF